MQHVLIKYAHVFICISAGEGSRHFSAFIFIHVVDDNRIALQPITQENSYQRDYVNASYIDV